MADEDQDALAAEWAAALEDSGDSTDTADTAPEGDVAAAPAEAAPVVEAAPTASKNAAGEDVDDDALAAEWAAALAGGDDEPQAQPEPQEKAKPKPRGESFSTEAKTASFVDFTDEAKSNRSEEMKNDLDFILDIPLDVSAELGRARLLINELLQLGQGSVVELNKLAGEPLEVYVNGKIIARGEAVVINEKFGIRLTDIISPIERVKQLG